MRLDGRCSMDTDATGPTVANDLLAARGAASTLIAWVCLPSAWT